MGEADGEYRPRIIVLHKRQIAAHLITTVKKNRERERKRERKREREREREREKRERERGRERERKKEKAFQMVLRGLRRS